MEDKDQIYFVKQSPLEFERTADGKLVVSGWSVHTGVFQGGTVEIPASELGNIAESLAGKQLRKDHSHTTDSVVGQITETRVGLDKGVRKKGVRYKGVVRDENLEQKITDGFIQDVSIGFHLYPECSVCGEDFRRCPHYFDDDARVIARDCDCYEQSFVPIGADGNSTIEPGAAFSAQFDYKKKDEMEEKVMDNKPEPTEEIISLTAEKLQIPPINIVITNDGGEEAKFSDKENGNGEKMEDIEKLQEQLSDMEGKLAEVTQEKEDVVEELGTVKSEKEDLETEIEQLKEQLTTTEASLKEYQDAEEEAVKLAKEELCKEIAALQVEKELLEEDKAEEKIAELSELDDKALGEMKVMLQAIKKEEKTEEPSVGEYHKQESGAPAMEVKDEIDFEDKEYRDAVFAQMLNIRPKKE